MRIYADKPNEYDVSMNPMDALKKSAWERNIPILIVHGNEDKVVPISNSVNIYNRLITTQGREEQRDGNPISGFFFFFFFFFFEVATISSSFDEIRRHGKHRSLPARRRSGNARECRARFFERSERDVIKFTPLYMRVCEREKNIGIFNPHVAQEIHIF